MTSSRWVVMGRKGAQVWQPISSARRDDGAEAGFTLLEVICVVAIVAILAAITLPLIPHGTSGARLRGFAASVAATFKADRNAAIRRQTLILTQVENTAHFVRSGATGRTIWLPSDVAMDVLLPASCKGSGIQGAVVFLPSGMSCGGVVT